MAWVAVTKYGVEWVFPFKPTRDYPYWDCTGLKGAFYGMALKEGSIKRLTGKELNYNDEPVELK